MVYKTIIYKRGSHWLIAKVYSLGIISIPSFFFLLLLDSVSHACLRIKYYIKKEKVDPCVRVSICVWGTTLQIFFFFFFFFSFPFSIINQPRENVKIKTECRNHLNLSLLKLKKSILELSFGFMVLVIVELVGYSLLKN